MGRSDTTLVECENHLYQQPADKIQLEKKKSLNLYQYQAAQTPHSHLLFTSMMGVLIERGVLLSHRVL